MLAAGVHTQPSHLQSARGHSFHLGPRIGATCCSSPGHGSAMILRQKPAAVPAMRPSRQATHSHRKSQLPSCSMNPLADSATQKYVDRAKISCPDRRILKALETLEHRLGDSITTAQLSKELGLSVSRFCHLFKQHTGSTLSAVLKQKRFARAVDLIMRSDSQISQICYNVGFNDLANFDHLFRRQFKCCPREFRRRISLHESTHPRPSVEKRSRVPA